MPTPQMEWIRCITIGLAIFSLVEYYIYYRKKHTPAVLAPMSWLLLVVGYSIFKWVVDGLPEYYFASVVWNNVILIQGVLLLLAFLFIFRGIKRNGH